MKTQLIGIILTLIPLTVSLAQHPYDRVLESVESNNNTLKALREQAATEKITNRTGIYLPDPEVEFHHLWGSPQAIGNRTDFSVTQSFDFPTAYGHRREIADLQDRNAALTYQSERIGILLEANQMTIGMIYLNARKSELRLRLANAERISATTRKKLDNGEANILEYNKAQLNLTAIEAEMSLLQAEQAALESELRRLNGGKEIKITDDHYPPSVLPANFASWVAEMEQINPLLQYVKGEIAIGRQQVKLSRALTLPRFKAGYMSEKVVGEQFQGIAVGISLPLWENKNRIQEARARVKTTEAILEDQKRQLYNHLEGAYLKASVLQKNATRLRQSLTIYRSETLLKKALDAGEISLLDYLTEVGYYYDALDKVLETERDYELAVAELNAMGL
ncbi:MAG: TolC family protein [bacterium]|nr:TolC family protein [bacterium]MDD3625016.1 TolC family protein [Proteiniphilum sp.]